jgi:hypothetical protein
VEARNRSLKDWFPRISTGQIKLPRFQRHESWGTRQIEGLLQSVVSQLPAGSVLTLEVAGEEPFVSRYLPAVKIPQPERVNEHLLDGQQRLTALWKTLTDQYEDRAYFVNLEPNTDIDAEFSITATNKYYKSGNLYPNWLNDPVGVWNRKLIPVYLLAPTSEAEANANEWAKCAANGNSDSQIEINQKLNRLRNLFANFNIPFLSLPSTTKPAVALDVFIRLNTSATPLSPFDVVVAQAEAATGESLHSKIQQLKHAVPELEKYSDVEEAILSISALYLDKAPVRKSFLDTGFAGALIQNFPDLQRGIQRAISVLEEERIFSAKTLPTEIAFFVIAALWARNPVKIDTEGNLRSLSKEYLWRSFVTNRYEKTGSTRALADLKQISQLFQDGDRARVEMFQETLYPLPSEADLRLAGWPSRSDRLAKAMLALSLRAGAFDFADGSEISIRNHGSRELHHVFPRNFISDQPDSLANRALNCGFISMPTNRSISDKGPQIYLSDRIDASNLGEQEVRKRVESHLIPFDAFMKNDYDAFISARASMMHKTIRNLFTTSHDRTG